MDNIASLPQIHEALDSLGYESTLSDKAVAVKIGGLTRPFTAVITHNSHTRQFQFTCQVALLGQIPEEKIPHFALAALDANNRIVPFAYALISAEDDPTLTDPTKWPVVLIHAVPIGDFSTRELAASMHSLLGALVDSRIVIQSLSAKV